MKMPPTRLKVDRTDICYRNTLRRNGSDCRLPTCQSPPQPILAGAFRALSWCNIASSNTGQYADKGEEAMAAQRRHGRFVGTALVSGPLLVAGAVWASPAQADETSYLNDLHNSGIH